MAYDDDLASDEELIPPADEDLHPFRPVTDAGAEVDEITSGCACGWRGGTYVVAENGYQEAVDEHRAHVLAATDEPELPT